MPDSLRIVLLQGPKQAKDGGDNFPKNVGVGFTLRTLKGPQGPERVEPVGKKGKKMAEVEVSKVIELSRDKAYEMLKDIKSWPKYAGFVKSANVVEEEGNTILVDMVEVIMGEEIPATNKFTLSPPEKVEFEEVKGKFPGMKVDISLSEVPEGTKVSMKMDIGFSGFEDVVRSFAQKALEDISKALEG